VSGDPKPAGTFGNGSHSPRTGIKPRKEAGSGRVEARWQARDSSSQFVTDDCAAETGGRFEGEDQNVIMPASSAPFSRSTFGNAAVRRLVRDAGVLAWHLRKTAARMTFSPFSFSAVLA
jgi:hypothetical protein